MIFPLRCSKPAASLLCFTLLLCTGSAQAADPSLTPTPPALAAAPDSAEATSFDAVTARLDRGGSFYLYLSAEQWLSNLSQQILEWRVAALPHDTVATDPNWAKIGQGFDLAAAFVKKSGLEQITGVGASSLALEPGVYRNTLFVHHAKGAELGLLKTLFGSAPHSLSGLDLLPADTALANFGDGDVAALITALRQTLEQSGSPEVKQGLADGLKQFAGVTGMSLDDFLQSLGGSSGLVLTLDPAKPVELQMAAGQKQTIPSPRLAILIEVKDDRIYQRLDQTLGLLPLMEKSDEPGLRMLAISLPLSALPFNVRATVARWDKFLILASDDRLVRDIIAAQKTGQGFKASPTFAKLSAGVPVEGNGFSLMTETFTNAVKRCQKAMLEKQPNTDPEQVKWMKTLFNYQQMGATYGVTAHIEDGWLSVSKGPQSLNQAVVPLLILPLAVGAGVAGPLWQSAQQKSTATP